MERAETATVSGGGQYRRIEVRRVIEAPIDRVWTAITDVDEVRQWWTDGTIDAREGGRVRLGGEEPPDSELFTLDGRVKVCLPPHVFEFTWNEAYDPAEGLVRFDLVDLGDGRTEVTVVNLVPARHEVPATAGWHELVERLGTYLTTGKRVPHSGDGARFRELRDTYEALASRGRTPR